MIRTGDMYFLKLYILSQFSNNNVVMHVWHVNLSGQIHFGWTNVYVFTVCNLQGKYLVTGYYCIEENFGKLRNYKNIIDRIIFCKCVQVFNVKAIAM